jgi:hypothetical protein
VASGVGVIQRIVSGVGVAVQRLGIVGAGNDAIRGDESTDLRIVEPGFVIIETQFVIVFLVGEGVTQVTQKEIQPLAPQTFVVQISKNKGDVAFMVARILHPKASLGKILSHRIRK